MASPFKGSRGLPLDPLRPLSLLVTPGPIQLSPRALHPPPWPEPCRRTRLKFAPPEPPPPRLIIPWHHHDHRGTLPCYFPSSPWPCGRAPSPPSAPPTTADEAPASDHPCGRSAPWRMRRCLLDPLVCWASPEMASATVESAGTVRPRLLCLRMCLRGRLGMNPTSGPHVSATLRAGPAS